MKKLIAALILLIVLVGCGSNDLNGFVSKYNKEAKNKNIEVIEDNNVSVDKEKDELRHITFNDSSHAFIVEVDNKEKPIRYFISYPHGVDTDKHAAYESYRTDGYLAIQALAKVLGLDQDKVFDEFIYLRETLELNNEVSEVVTYRESGWQITIEEFKDLGISVWFDKAD